MGIVAYRASHIGWSQTGHSQNGLQPKKVLLQIEEEDKLVIFNERCCIMSIRNNSIVECLQLCLALGLGVGCKHICLRIFQKYEVKFSFYRVVGLVMTLEYQNEITPTVIGNSTGNRHGITQPDGTLFFLIFTYLRGRSH